MNREAVCSSAQPAVLGLRHCADALPACLVRPLLAENLSGTLILPTLPCSAVVAEFVLTGLSNPDGNRLNHEIGICLPQFTLNVTSACALTIKSKYATASYISLLQVGRDAHGAPLLPLASDRPAAIAAAVNEHVGYYYLEPTRCPQLYTTRIKGAKLLASGMLGLLLAQ